MPISAYSLARKTYAALGVETETALRQLRAAESAGGHALRLALFEEVRALTLGAVWDEFCRREDVPVGLGFMDEVKTYERTVPARR